MKVTLKEIAKHCGCSMPTVSHILNDKEGYSQDTRDKVMTVARRLGYRPNTSARSIKTGKFNCITWLSSTHGTSRFITTTLLDSVIAELEKHQMQLHITRVNDEKLTDASYIPSALKHLSSDGLLIDYTQDIPVRFWDLIQETRLPAIWINSKQKYDAVYPNDIQDVNQLTQTMIKQGHSRIGYVRYGGSESHYSVADRLAGYEQAMNLAGLAPLICQVNESIQLPVDVFCEKLIDENPLITAWVCYGDNVAVALSLVLINRGMDIHKVYQIGTPSAGISVLDHMTKYLPVVVTPEKWTKVGSIAVQMLLKKIKNPDRRLPANSV